MNFRCNLDCLNCVYADCVAPDDYSVDVTLDSATAAIEMEKISLLEYMQIHPEATHRMIFSRFHIGPKRIKQIYKDHPEIEKAHNYALRRKREAGLKDYKYLTDYMREHPELTVREIKKQFHVSSNTIYRLWDEYPDIRKDFLEIWEDRKAVQLAECRRKVRKS